MKRLLKAKLSEGLDCFCCRGEGYQSCQTKFSQQDRSKSSWSSVAGLLNPYKAKVRIIDHSAPTSIYQGNYNMDNTDDRLVYESFPASSTRDYKSNSNLDNQQSMFRSKEHQPLFA